MSVWLYETLLPLAAAAGASHRSAHVFGWPDGRPYDGWDVRRQFLRALAACTEIPDDKKKTVVLHTLRHTAASLMVAEGVRLFDVAKVLGHSSVLVTMRYAHFAPEAGRAGIEALGRTLRGAPEAQWSTSATGPMADGVSEGVTATETDARRTPWPPGWPAGRRRTP